MLFEQWAFRHGVSRTALEELKQIVGLGEFIPQPPCGSSEAAIQDELRLNSSKEGGRLWRNNVGACKDEKGNFIRYGLANESTRVNSHVKSSDLIGITPVTITQNMVGSLIGQFTAIEVKRASWNPKKVLDSHELAQLKFLMLVITLGGRAHFANRGDML